MQPNFFLSLGSLQLMHEPQPSRATAFSGHTQEIK
jgi:hypothetical protein